MHIMLRRLISVHCDKKGLGARDQGKHFWLLTQIYLRPVGIY